MSRGNAQRRCKPRTHTRASTNQATAAGSIARSQTNSTVCRFISLRLTPRQNSLSEIPQPQYAASEQAPPQHYQAPQQYTGSSNFHAPVQPPAPKQKHSIPRIFHYSKCTGKKKAVCVRFGTSRSRPNAKLDADEPCVRIGRDQLHGDAQRIERLRERRQECSQVPHEYV